MAEKQRESWIDICKGIAIILVVMGHVRSTYLNSGLLKDAVLFNYIGTWIYSFHMPLFFMISGLLFSMSKRKTVGYEIKKKSLSYGIPYIVFSILLGGGKIIFSSYVNGILNPTDLLKIFIYPLTFFWFLYALLVIEIIQILVDYKLKQKWLCHVIVFLALAIKILAHNLSTFDTQINIKDLGIIDAAKFYFWFVFGEYYLAIIIGRIKTIIAKINFIIVGLMILADGIIVLLIYSSSIENVFIDIIVAFLGCIIVCVLAMHINRNRLLEYVGKQTMPIYLFHGVVLSVFRILISKLGLPLFDGLMPIIVCALFGTIIPITAYEIFKRIKVFDFCIYPTRYINLKE